MMQKLDIFGSPFYQKINQDNYKKKTTLGGIFSILLISFSISYFIFLVVQINSGQTTPKFLQCDESTDEPMDFDIYSNELFLGFINNQYDIIQYEKENKIQFFDVILDYGDVSYEKQQIIINSQPVDNILSFGNLQNNTKLSFQSNPNFYLYGKILTIHVAPCSGNFLRNLESRCATQKEIENLISSDITVFLYVLQNSFSKKKQQAFKKLFTVMTNQINFNQTQISLARLSIEDVTIKNGLFKQSTQNYKQIYQLDQQNLIQSLDKQPKYAEITFYIDNQVRYIQIEYAQILEVLAQVWAITSILYLCRYIFLKFSLKYLAQDFSSTQLKYFYKKTALKLQEENEEVIQDYSNLNVHQTALFVAKQNEKIEQNNNYFQISRSQKQFQIYYFLKQNQINFQHNQNSKYFSNFQHFLIYDKRWKTFLLPKICLRSKKNLDEKQKMLNRLESQANKDLCFFEMQKEFLRLKIAVKLLLTPEQYSAILMCGCELLDTEQSSDQDQSKNSAKKDCSNEKLENFDCKFSNFSNSSIEDPINSYSIQDFEAQNSNQQEQNHLELIEKVDRDPEFRQKCLQNFISEVLEIGDSSCSLLNQRILNSMIGVQFQDFNLKENVNNCIQKEYPNMQYQPNNNQNISVKGQPNSNQQKE